MADSDGRSWDFDNVVMRDLARGQLLRESPMILAGISMCTAFSTWQRINNMIGYPLLVKGELKRAKQHLEFGVELFRKQVKAGRYLLHKHPAYASAWQTDMMESIMKDEGVVKATADQCQHACTDEHGNPAKKPTS